MTSQRHFETDPRRESVLAAAQEIDGFARRYAMTTEEAWSFIRVYNNDRAAAERAADQLQAR